MSSSANSSRLSANAGSRSRFPQRPIGTAPAEALGQALEQGDSRQTLQRRAAQSTHEHPLAAIVPAYNEERTLAAVLASLQALPTVFELLVVSDGSTDHTVAIARDRGVRVVELEANRGKGQALAAGVAATSAPVLLFVDGDVLDLTPALLTDLTSPVLRGAVVMNIGVRDRGRWLNGLQHIWGPRLSGIRCLRREVFDAVPAEYREGFRIETALNHVCARAGWPVLVTVLAPLRHLVKERKRGLLRGALARVTMFSAVFAAWARLILTRPALPVLSSTAHGAAEFSSNP